MQDDFEGLKMFLDSVPFKSAVLAGLLILMRFFYNDDRRKWHRKVLELAICVVTTYGASKGLKAVGIGEEGSWLVAIALGWMGADYVREHAKLWFKKKFEE